MKRLVQFRHFYVPFTYVQVTNTCRNPVKCNLWRFDKNMTVFGAQEACKIVPISNKNVTQIQLVCYATEPSVPPS